MTFLSEAPSSALDTDGRPRTGTYRGYCRDTDLTNLRSDTSGATGAGERWLREKQWQWFLVADAEIACGGTLFGAGYATTAFVWVFDRTSERMLADHTELLPPFMADISNDPRDEALASLRGFERLFEFDRDGDRLTLEITLDSVRLDCELDTSTVLPMTAICRPEGREQTGANITQKQVCLPARGRIDVQGRTFELDDGGGMLDYSHGLLPRETAWKWAIAGGRLDDGTPVGFNVSEGINGAMENAVWLDDKLRTTDPVHVDFDAESIDSPWHVYSEDGSIDVTLTIEGVRRHQTNLPLVSFSYHQPLGCWHGRLIDREVHGLFGVAEHHEARW